VNLRLTRWLWGNKSVIGRLTVDGRMLCFTLEDKDRGLTQEMDSDELTLTKVPGQTAIPYGTYLVTIDDSARFKRPMPHILDVPGFAGVRIHPGNTDVETEGCVLLGSHVQGDDFVTDSVAAFNLFLPLLAKAVLTDKVTLTIDRQVNLAPV
jgi:hypothetical protein